jgi:hypothetical protein
VEIIDPNLEPYIPQEVQLVADNAPPVTTATRAAFTRITPIGVCALKNNEREDYLEKFYEGYNQLLIDSL